MSDDVAERFFSYVDERKQLYIDRLAEAVGYVSVNRRRFHPPTPRPFDYRSCLIDRIGVTPGLHYDPTTDVWV